MGTIVRTRIVKIGNSQGIRIPKILLDLSKLDKDVELEVKDGCIIIRSRRPARAGWDEQFQSMAEAADDVLLDGELLSADWDEAEWEW